MPPPSDSHTFPFHSKCTEFRTITLKHKATTHAPHIGQAVGIGTSDTNPRTRQEEYRKAAGFTASKQQPLPLFPTTVYLASRSKSETRKGRCLVASFWRAKGQPVKFGVARILVGWGGWQVEKLVLWQQQHSANRMSALLHRDSGKRFRRRVRSKITLNILY